MVVFTVALTPARQGSYASSCGESSWAAKSGSSSSARMPKGRQNPASQNGMLQSMIGKAASATSARRPRWRRRVDSLRCLKGVDTATAADC